MSNQGQVFIMCFGILLFLLEADRQIRTEI
jgi:hypothetical protein